MRIKTSRSRRRPRRYKSKYEKLIMWFMMSITVLFTFAWFYFETSESNGFDEQEYRAGAEAQADSMKKAYRQEKAAPVLEGDDETANLFKFVEKVRKPLYTHQTETSPGESMPYDINNCPETPPENYPIEWPLLDVLNNWKPDETTFPSINERPTIHQGLCRFDYTTELDKAETYRKAEKPFIIRDDPKILQVVQRWAQPNYLSELLDPTIKYNVEYSKNNHLMYNKPPRSERRKPEGWEPPMKNIKMTYDHWLQKANQSLDLLGPDHPHWYFRVNAKDKREKHFMFDELPFFRSKENFYIIDTDDTRGINCRFGMKGNIAESHFDGSRNFIGLFGGERRYILNHPKNCKNLGLYAKAHPSGRHTSLDWSHPDLESVPEFADAYGNEVVLQAGDVLYLPQSWFHHIISLELNWQCNARSGITSDYREHISACGF